MPSIQSLNELGDNLNQCATALNAGERCPMQFIPCKQPLTEDGFLLTLLVLRLTGVEITSTDSNKKKYGPPPPERGFIGFFEIRSQGRTVGYWLASDEKGWHFVRAQLKLAR